MMEEMQAMYMVRENSRIARDDEYIWFKRCGLIYKAETMVMNNVPVLPRFIGSITGPGEEQKQLL